MSGERTTDLRARLSWAAAALGEFDLVLLVGFAERLAEQSGATAVPRAEPRQPAEPEPSSR